MNIIKEITIVNNWGTLNYRIGQKINGLIIHKINNRCLEYENSFISIYDGVTIKNELIFELMNMPVIVEYENE